MASNCAASAAPRRKHIVRNQLFDAVASVFGGEGIGIIYKRFRRQQRFIQCLFLGAVLHCDLRFFLEIRLDDTGRKQHQAMRERFVREAVGLRFAPRPQGRKLAEIGF